MKLNGGKRFINDAFYNEFVDIETFFCGEEILSPIIFALKRENSLQKKLHLYLQGASRELNISLKIEILKMLGL